MSKFQLQVSYDFDFVLLGLSSPAKYYHLCWHINDTCGLLLARADDLEMRTGKEKDVFVRMAYEDEDNYRSFDLIQNKGAHSMVLKEHSSADYLLKISGSEWHDMDGFVQDLKSLPIVQTVYEINLDAIGKKELLVF
jgi:hypothetical protein